MVCRFEPFGPKSDDTKFVSTRGSWAVKEVRLRKKKGVRVVL